MEVARSSHDLASGLPWMAERCAIAPPIGGAMSHHASRLASRQKSVSSAL